MKNELDIFELGEVNPPTYKGEKAEVDGSLAIAKPIKKIKIELYEDLKIESFESLVVIVGGLKFIKEDIYPWIDLYIGDNSDSGYALIDQLDGDDITTIGDLDDLRVFAINWYFNNVEIVKEVGISESVIKQEE